MVKPPCCEKNKVTMKDGRFPEEVAYATKQGANSWTAMPKKSGLRRCGKSCRIRWNGSQRPDQGDDNFTPEEEDLIIKLHSTIGSRWTIIAQQLPGRTDNDVKNLWNTKLKKKLSALGIDPVTHRPFSQILADYGNISGFPKARNRFGCLSRDMKNVFNLKPEQDHPRSPPSYFNCHFPSRNIAPNNSELFLSNSDLNISAAANQSLDLLSQLQAITMVTEPSDYANSTQQMQTECTYSSASSSSPESPPSATNNQANVASPGFSWCDFLLEDAYAPTHAAQEQEAGITIPQHEAEKETNAPLKAIVDSASTMSNGSFVDNMLEGENEMLSDFHGLLDDPFYY